MDILKKLTIPVLVSFALVFLIDLLTNNVPRKFLFDSLTYMGLAEKGFSNDYLISPFVYRYATPFIAGLTSRLTGLSLYKSFKLIAYVGGLTQLTGMYTFVNWITQSRKAAYTAMLVTAFSLFNLKYLLFDVYRADHLAYAFILLASFLALREQFYLLLITTMVGLQFREFVIAPLLAYLFVEFRVHGLRALAPKVLPTLLGLFIAIGLPRILIPVREDLQGVEISYQGLTFVVSTLLNLKRNINFLFVTLAYCLPLLILYETPHAKTTLNSLARERKIFFFAYLVVVLLLMFLGGTDLDRFATYLFLFQGVMIGLLAEQVPLQKIFLFLLIQVIFNRILWHFPEEDLQRYIDFYGGYNDQITAASLLRYLELEAWFLIGVFVMGPLTSSNSGSSEERLKLE